VQKSDKNFAGNPASYVYKILGISRDRFNGWRKCIDLDPSRNRFSEGDIIVYWAMYRLVVHGGIGLTKLKNQPSGPEIFNACYNEPFATLEKCRIVIYWDTNELVFLKPGEEKDQKIADKGCNDLPFSSVMRMYFDAKAKREVRQVGNVIGSKNRFGAKA
jgi:hypothetical protein